MNIQPHITGSTILKIIFIGLTLVSFSSHSSRAEDQKSTDSKPYEGHLECAKPKDCKVDLSITRGQRAFSQCQVCHGLDGAGSTIAPSLLDKLQELDKQQFVDVVTNGKQGQIGVMPAWKENPNVMKYLDDLYAYLLARSDGQLQAGRLERYDQKNR